MGKDLRSAGAPGFRIGIDLGYIKYLILRPEPLADELTLRAIWFPALILVVFTGFLEEIIFRGLMQTAFRAKIGRWLGILLVSGLFAVLHLGYQSLLDVIFVFLRSRFCLRLCVAF